MSMQSKKLDSFTKNMRRLVRKPFLRQRTPKFVFVSCPYTLTLHICFWHKGLPVLVSRRFKRACSGPGSGRDSARTVSLSCLRARQRTTFTPTSKAALTGGTLWLASMACGAQFDLCLNRLIVCITRCESEAANRANVAETSSSYPQRHKMPKAIHLPMSCVFHVSEVYMYSQP